LRHVVEIAPEAAESLRAEMGGVVQLEPTGDGRTVIRVSDGLSQESERRIAEALPPAARAGFAEAAKAYRHERERLLSPAERGAVFVAPRLVAEVQGEFVFADGDELFEAFDWSPLDYPVRLTPQEFNVRESAVEFEIDLDGRRLGYSILSEQDRLVLDAPVDGWDRVNLSIWLDKEIRQPDILPSQLLRWVQDAIAHLVVQRELSVAALWRAKYVLAGKLAEKVAASRASARKKGYQQYLFAPEAKVSVSREHGFRFHADMFSDARKQPRGRYRFQKHYLGEDNIPLLSGKPNGEELQCAVALDRLPQIEFWLRNVSKHKNAFRFGLANGNFYPDFVAKLKNGRIFVVEYKGELLAGVGNEETNEKRAVGELWERSGGGLFLLVEKEIGGMAMREQMLAKLGE
jgi:type III restriction enzyme